MTRSDLHKEKHGSKNQLPEDGILDGTSARTRPLSFDDIMLRRRNKGDSAKQISNAHDVADFESSQDNSVTPIELPECGQQMNQDSEPMDKKNNSNYSKKVGSERKGKTRSSRKDDKLVQANDEGSLDPDAKSKKKETKNASSNIVSGGKHERENHGNRKKAGHLSIDSVNGSDKRKDRDSYKKDRLSERCRVKSEIVKNQQQNEEREVYRKRKPDGHSDSDIEYKKRNVKDERKTEKLTSRGREKPEKENRHKRHHEDHKPRDRITVKKNDTEKKGLETSRTYPEEAGPKRRRSRSREREKDRGRRSRSQSPKAYKHTSKDGRELVESVLSHSTKDRSGREHSDVDKKRTSSNGSGSHYRRNTASSGLGGYSPRKRKTEAAAKTPSPTRRSPERRNAGWDFQNAEKESSVADSTVSYMNTASQSLLLNVELPSVSPVTTSVVQPIGVTLHSLSSQMHAIEAIQLTQATRPMRRLYVENLPASASEEDLKECINKLLMSTGVNYVQGTQPCISSIIHKEKNQALLEFLTPEDASAALSLDGISFSGSSLKIRRPKDYAIVTTGLSDKSVGTVDSVSDIVEDSPNKIFIGGISKLYSSKMLMEIAKAFGAVKSFHFEFIADINEPCAFLEYVDHSVTSKACAGLNGMRLGGQVLTVVPATPEPVLVENVGKRPIYVIPEHVKPLLEKPTTVVKLKNVLDPECLLSLAESEVEEILQDIKLECSRFGTVKSVNVAKTTNSFATMEAHEVKNTSASVDVSNFEQLGETSCGAERVDKSEPQEAPNELENNRQTLEDRDGFANSSGISDLLSGSIEPKEINDFKLVEDSLNDEIIKGNVKRNETCGPPMNDDDASAKDQENLSGLAGEFKEQNNVEFVSSIDEELKSEEKSSKMESFADVESDERTKDSDGDKKDPTLADVERVFEAGCVFVEYRREEAACMAAHCLHGRTFDGRIVSVEYVGQDVYQTRFHG